MAALLGIALCGWTAGCGNQAASDPLEASTTAGTPPSGRPLPAAKSNKPATRPAAPRKRNTTRSRKTVSTSKAGRKPKLALVISGRQEGYLEPCGCAGLEQQKGGLSRRYTLHRRAAAARLARGRGGRRLAGAPLRPPGRNPVFDRRRGAAKKWATSAVGFGPADLRLSAGEVVAAVAGADPEDSIFVSANVSLFGLTPKVRIIEAGGMKMGITAVLGKEYQAQVNNPEVEIAPAAEAHRAVVGELKDCDVRILLAQCHDGRD